MSDHAPGFPCQRISHGYCRVCDLIDRDSPHYSEDYRRRFLPEEFSPLASQSVPGVATAQPQGYEYFKSELARRGYRILEHADQPWPDAVQDIQDMMHPFLAAEAPAILGQAVVSCLPTTKQPKAIQMRVWNMKSEHCQCACASLNREVRLEYLGDCVYYAQWNTLCVDVPVQYAEVMFAGGDISISFWLVSARRWNVPARNPIMWGDGTD